MIIRPLPAGATGTSMTLKGEGVIRVTGAPSTFESWSQWGGCRSRSGAVVGVLRQGHFIEESPSQQNEEVGEPTRYETRATRAP